MHKIGFLCFQPRKGVKQGMEQSKFLNNILLLIIYNTVDDKERTFNIALYFVNLKEKK